jgi:hypothetical protein
LELIGSAGLVIAYGVNSFAGIMMNSTFSVEFAMDLKEKTAWDIGPDANWWQPTNSKMTRGIHWQRTRSQRSIEWISWIGGHRNAMDKRIVSYGALHSLFAES